VIGHRGAAAYAPENTLASFRMAQDMGADWFELDVHLTKDGQVIVIHDEKVDRTTNGHGEVRDMTLAQLRELDAGSKKDPKFAGEKLPTLAEALDLGRTKTGVYLEIKNDDDDTDLMAKILRDAEGQAHGSDGLLRDMMRHIEDSGTRNLELTRKTITLIREHRMARRVIVQSFSPIVCAIMLAEAPEIRTEYLGAEIEKHPEYWENYMRWAALLPVAGMNVNHESITEERMKAFHKAGRTVAVWTVDDEAIMRRLVGWGVDGIISNRPDVALRVVKEMGKHS
jgi:glycerophosphoryl diester phosphodiesterase